MQFKLSTTIIMLLEYSRFRGSGWWLNRQRKGITSLLWSVAATRARKPACCSCSIQYNGRCSRGRKATFHYFYFGVSHVTDPEPKSVGHKICELPKARQQSFCMLLPYGSRNHKYTNVYGFSLLNIKKKQKIFLKNHVFLLLRGLAFLQVRLSEGLSHPMT